MAAWKSDTGFDEMHTVLIVSRDAEMVSVWETLFRQKNCPVISEESPEHALQTSRLIRPSLIVLDLDLPGDERLSLCRALRATTQGALLLLLPERDEMEIYNYHFAGVNEILPTPISPMALLVKSMAWLARQEWLIPYPQHQGAYT